MAPRLPIADHGAVLEGLLLSPSELMDRSWEPDVSLADFFHLRLRPSIYFLQRCLVGEEGLEGEAIQIPPEEMVVIRRHMVAAMGMIRLLARARFDGVNVLERAIRANVGASSGVAATAAKYFVPGESCNMFSIMQHLVNRVDFEYWWAPALDLSKSLVIDFWLLVQTSARRPGGCVEYPEFDTVGNLDADGLRSSSIASILVPITCVFASHPTMRRISDEILEPLLRHAIQIREAVTFCYHWKGETEKLVLRKRIRDYLELACQDLAAARRFPVPHAASLRMVIRAASSYGFTGNDDPLVAAVLQGKLASLCQYSIMLQERVVEQIVKGEENGEDDPGMPLYADACVVRSVADAWQIDPRIESELQNAQFRNLDYREYVSEREAHITYVQDFIRPYAEMIWLCIPAGSHCASQLPVGRVKFLSAHNISLITAAALLLTIAKEHAILMGSSLWAPPPRTKLG
ncbi:hypothetical protein FB451DRAFT_1190892 [Mycena latifolia]|nr:hypothetical protein FB451DRAFT_1190892 [Mycena latifolia]